jgi:sRNA-binding protein
MTRRDETDLTILVEAFPRCFFRGEHLRQPLKVGILHELLAHPNLGISRVRLRRIMGAYANSQGYLTNTVEGAVRIGLDGQPAGAVTAGEAERAHGRLSREAGSREEKAAHAVANMQVEGPQASAQNPEETFPPVSSEEPVPQPSPPPSTRVGLAGLKAAALARKGRC